MLKREWQISRKVRITLRITVQENIYKGDTAGNEFVAMKGECKK